MNSGRLPLQMSKVAGGKYIMIHDGLKSSVFHMLWAVSVREHYRAHLLHLEVVYCFGDAIHAHADNDRNAPSTEQPEEAMPAPAAILEESAKVTVKQTGWACKMHMLLMCTCLLRSLMIIVKKCRWNRFLVRSLSGRTGQGSSAPRYQRQQSNVPLILKW